MEKNRKKIVILVIILCSILLLCCCSISAIVLFSGEGHDGSSNENSNNTESESNTEGKESEAENDREIDSDQTEDEKEDREKSDDSDDEIPPFRGQAQDFDKDEIFDYVELSIASNPIYPETTIVEITRTGSTVTIIIDYDPDYSVEAAKYDSISIVEYVYDNNYEGVEKVDFESDLCDLSTTKDTYRDYYRKMTDADGMLDDDEIIEILSSE